jgi:predicted chitinase
MKSFLFIILIAFITSKKYTVKPGDTLGAIAAKYGVTVQDLVSWNNIANPDRIEVGLKLIVSKKGQSSKTGQTEKPSTSTSSTGGSKVKGNKKVSTVTDSQMKKMGWSNYNLPDLNRCLKKYDITTSKRIRHFIAQCSHESALGRYTQELGGPSYCAKYDGRKDLGNTQKGDGCRFKGAGYIQLTGRSNYQEFANSIGDKEVMEGFSYISKKYPWSSAGFWWKKNNMNILCDKGASVRVITKKVNGGKRGLSQRQKYYDKACSIF